MRDVFANRVCCKELFVYIWADVLLYATGRRVVEGPVVSGMAMGEDVVVLVNGSDTPVLAGAGCTVVDDCCWTGAVPAPVPEPAVAAVAPVALVAPVAPVATAPPVPWVPLVATSTAVPVCTDVV